MQINLKEHSRDRETLKYVQSVLRQAPVTKGLANKLGKIIDFYESIELDLELSGECIMELDTDRLKAIEERNKMLSFLNQSDDL